MKRGGQYLTGLELTTSSKRGWRHNHWAATPALLSNQVDLDEMKK